MSLGSPGDYRGVPGRKEMGWTSGCTNSLIWPLRPSTSLWPDLVSHELYNMAWPCGLALLSARQQHVAAAQKASDARLQFTSFSPHLKLHRSCAYFSGCLRKCHGLDGLNSTIPFLAVQSVRVVGKFSCFCFFKFSEQWASQWVDMWSRTCTCVWPHFCFLNA